MAAIYSLAFAVLWLILWNVFAMEWYSFFFDSIIGSNIHLFLLFTVITILMCGLFSRLTKINISASLNYIVNIICMFAVTYTFSIFRYEHSQWIAVSVLLHIFLMTFVIGFSKPYDDKVLTPLIKRKPFSAAGWALLYAVLTDSLNLMLFYSIAYTFDE